MTALAPQQAVQTFMIEKSAMFISPSSAYPDPSQLYEALFGKAALRNAGGVELPGFRVCRCDHGGAGPGDPQGGVRQAAALRHRAGDADAAIHLAAVSVASSKVQNFHDSLLSVPKFTEVWLQA